TTLFRSHLSRTTRYGRMQFNATRFRAFADQLPAAADDPSQSIMCLFDEAGLLDNWPALLRGEAGTAYIYDRTAADSDAHPFFQVTWFEPDAQLAAAVMAALEAAARRPEHPAIVTKLTLADREVLHLALPMVTDLHGWPGPFEPGERLFVPDYGHVLAT